MSTQTFTSVTEPATIVAYGDFMLFGLSQNVEVFLTPDEWRRVRVGDSIFVYGDGIDAQPGVVTRVDPSSAIVGVRLYS